MTTEAIEYRHELSGLRKLIRRYPEVTAEETITVMDMVIARLESEVVRHTPAGVGGAAGLRGSIHGEVVSSRHGEIAGLVGSPLAYAEPVEFGTRPHFPPARPLILWASRKLGLSGQELRRTVRAIQWKISRRGTTGAHMFGRSFKSLDGWMRSQLETIPTRVAQRINDGAI